MSPRRTATSGHAAIELALIGVTALCVADILCR
ncbi:Ms4533A family Cys-rich leader peptide [Streptomyces sp. NPDC087420]